MQIARRRLLLSGATALAGSGAGAFAARRLGGLRIGVTDWNLGLTGKVEALALASNLGFEGVEVSFGRKPGADKLPLDNAELEAQYLQAVRQHKTRIAGTCLDILHVNCVKNDPLGRKWVADGIPVTARLKAGVMLLPFFGRCSAATAGEQEYVADVLKELAPEAEKSGVVMGLENMLSAEDNARILDRVNSKALGIYYDVGNSRNAGFDPVREIRWLGKKRICQIHFKDKGYLGEGSIDFPGVLKAIDDIGYKGFANLETSSPSKNIEADMKRNLAYIRKLMA